MNKNNGNDGISLFWWKRDRGQKKNFGDDMSPLLLEYATGRPVYFAEPIKADVIGVGSVLQQFCSLKKATRSIAFRAVTSRRLKPIIWGSGTTGATAKKTNKSLGLVPWHLDIRALRGPRTEGKLGVTGKIYGDPALLASRVWPRPSSKSYLIGIVPHYSDLASPELEQLMQKFPRAKIISVENEASQVVREIASCELILASSLHGLIVADSFGIPNYRIRLRGEISGGDFKFLDYAGGVGRPDISTTEINNDNDLFTGNFDYQKDIDCIAERLVNSISDLAR